MLWTDADYKTEEKFVFDQLPGIKNTLDDVLNEIGTLDNIVLYDFMQALETTEQFNDVNDCLQIAFTDSF